MILFVTGELRKYQKIAKNAIETNFPPKSKSMLF